MKRFFHRRSHEHDEPVSKKPQSIGAAPLQNLSMDVYVEIFKYLDFTDLNNLREVCKKFSSISNEESIDHIIFSYYQRFFLEKFKKIPESFKMHHLMQEIKRQINKNLSCIPSDTRVFYRSVIQSFNPEDKKSFLNLFIEKPQLACEIQYININSETAEIHNFFTWAVYWNKQALLNEIYQQQCQLIGDKNKTDTAQGFSKMHWAILCHQSLTEIKKQYSNSLSVIKELNHNAGEIAAPFSILMCAIIMNRIDVLDYLFSKNPRLSINYFVQNCPFSPLMLAIIFNRKEIVEFLLEKHPKLDDVPQISNIENKESVDTPPFPFLVPYELDLEKIKDDSVIELSEALHRDDITAMLRQKVPHP